MNSIEIYDIYDIWYSPYWWESKTVWLIASIFLGCFIIVLLYYLKKKFAKKEDPVQKASRQLLRLCHEKNKISHQVLYSTLTQLLKEYLCYHYGNALQGKTDNELIISLQNETRAADIIDEVITIFQGVELIKFANQQTIITKRDEDLKKSKYIIEKLNQKLDKNKSPS